MQPELMAQSVVDGRTSRNCFPFDATFVGTVEIASHETDVVRLDHFGKLKRQTIAPSVLVWYANHGKKERMYLLAAVSVC